MNRDELRRSIDTIVIVMMENRSFDHVLGHLRLSGRGDVDGIRSLEDPAYANPSESGAVLFPFLTAGGLFPNKDDAILRDLPHDPDLIQTQLAPSAAAGGACLMNGFVRAYEAYQTAIRVQQPAPLAVMKPSAVPTMGFFAQTFLVCDRWFSAVPSSTQPNRLMALSGVTPLRDGRSDLLPNQDTFFEWLNDRNVRFRVYSAGYPFVFLMPSLATLLIPGRRDLGQLADDVQNEADGSFPQVLWIEPESFNAPIHATAPSDDHAPLELGPGEQFLGTVYNALRSNPARWARTLLVITFDEHGGFFDHVAPLPIPYAGPGFNFESTGVRVPAIVASPFVAAGSVSHASLDHTSILQLLTERFGELDPATGDVVPFSAEVDYRRRLGIESVSAVLDASVVRPAPPACPPVPQALIPRFVAAAPLDALEKPGTPDEQAYAAGIKKLLAEHPDVAKEMFPGLAQK